MGNRVALYIRVSSEEQAKHGFSLDAQSGKLNAYCDIKEYDVVKRYSDEGISAGSIKKRKAFIQMLNDARNKQFDILVVTKIDRAFRNTRDALDVLELFKDSGVDFVSLAEQIDTTTPMGKVMFTIISAFAELERTMNTQRVKDVRFHRFNQGLFPAKSPYGYVAIKKNGRNIGFKLHPKQSKIVLDCFEMTARGEPYSVICKKHKLKPQSYYNIIKNKVYCGYVIFEGQEKKGIHKPIISEELFNKIQHGASTILET